MAGQVERLASLIAPQSLESITHLTAEAKIVNLHQARWPRSEWAGRKNESGTLHPVPIALIGWGGKPIAAQPESYFAIDVFLERHGAAVLRLARRYSASAVDADDAYQRAAEKLLVKRPDGRCEEQLLAWLMTVVRNEALMIRRRCSYETVLPFEDLLADRPAAEPPPDIRLIEIEGARRGSEALKRLKPDQARCLLLKADGLSYDEIRAETGFNYSKVHRCIAEGRKIARGLVDRIETGAECRRVEPLLSKILDDELKPAEHADVYLHLENCLPCRATLRDYAGAANEVASYFPVGAIAAGGVLASLADRCTAFWGWMNERAASLLPSSPASEIAFGKKLALAAALTGSVVAGGAGIDHFVSPPRDAPSLKPVAPALRLIEPKSVLDLPVRGGAASGAERAAKEPSGGDDSRPPANVTEGELLTARPPAGGSSGGADGRSRSDSDSGSDGQADPLAEGPLAESGEPLSDGAAQ